MACILSLIRKTYPYIVNSSYRAHLAERRQKSTIILKMFDVEASWSQAGVGTSFVLKERTNHKKALKIVFDLGW